MAQTEADKLSEANLTLSERIKRSGAAATAAKKSIKALGGEFEGAAKKVELEIQAMIDLQELQRVQLILEKKLSEGKLGAEAIIIIQKRVTENKSIVSSLEMQVDLQHKIAAANLKVATSKKGSREREQAAGELSQLKQLIPLLGRQSEIEKQLQGLAREKDPTAAVLERKKTLEGLQRTNQEHIKFVKSLDPAREAQDKFNAKLKEAKNVSDDYIRSLRERTAAQSVEITGGKTGIAAAEVTAMDQYGEAINKVLDKYSKMRLAADADLSIIDQQEIAEVTRMSAEFVKAGVSLKEFYKIKGAKEALTDLNKITEGVEDYRKSLEDAIKIRELELQMIGKSGLEITLLKEKIQYEKEVAGVRKSIAEARAEELKKNGNIVLNTLTAEKTLVEALTEAYNKNRESIAKDYAERRTWATGQEQALESYKDKAGNSAQQAIDFYGSIFTALESDMMNFFKTGEANFESFVKTILDGLIKIMIQKMIMQAITGFSSGGVFGGSTTPTATGSGVGGAAAPGGGVTQMAATGKAFDPTGIMAFAKGGAFNGSNGLVSTPTLFKFAGGTGLMGEAGPEAIMPLSRTTSGDLGVKVEGGIGSTSIVNKINIEVNVAADGSSTTEATGDEDAKALGKVIGARVREEIIVQRRPGGLLSR